MKLKIILSFIFTFTLLTLLSVKNVFAASYYVSTSGSDSNPGTSSSPWRTVQHAVNTVNPGDTIFIYAGTYYENVKLQKSGTSSAPITLTNHAGGIATIDGGSSAAIYTYDGIGY
jgi:hypothetical protein